jgi:predicted transposase/invertase (TIGR01784 family)
MSLHYFELPKLPNMVSANDRLQLWLKLFNAETEEELCKIEALEVPEMQQAIGAYRSVSAAPEFREIERLRSKARHDEAQALRHARLEGQNEGRSEGRMEREVEIARSLALCGIDVAIITDTTGLSSVEVDEILSEIVAQ